MRLISVYIASLFATVASGQSCIDDPERFVVRQNDGKDVFRSCEWARRADTVERCLIDTVYANCPGLCDPSCPCVDDTGKFGIKDLKANLLCKDGKKNNGKPKKRFCNIKKFANQCPETCKTKKSNKKDKKTKTVRTTVPSFQVTCDEDVKSWYRGLTYCDNFKFRYKCPQKCEVCPKDFRLPSSTPSVSFMPTSSPKPTTIAPPVSCEEDRKQRFELSPGEDKKSCEWAARDNTAARCAKPSVLENCPATCNPACPCAEDSKEEFGLKDVKAALLCEDGTTSDGKIVAKFCNIQKFNYLCEPTCEPNSSCSKQGTCFDKEGVINTKISTWQVKCGDTPEDWYKGTKDSYCDQPKYKYYCPNECGECPVKTSSPAPSVSSMPSISSRPSGLPSNIISSEPSIDPSTNPSNTPSISSAPSVSSVPSGTPSISNAPSTSKLPSMVPSGSPSDAPSSSTMPSSTPSDEPSTSEQPSTSDQPSSSPSDEPSTFPSDEPSTFPSDEPSTFPSESPV